MSNSEGTTASNNEQLKTLPSDDVRQIMWRFSDRFDLQMAVQSSRTVARGIVARLVADGARNSHEWTEEKNQLLSAFDESGITTLFIDPELGGYIEGPKNLALALCAFELAWVDAGAATCSLATNLALAPIHEKGTPEQRTEYMRRCVPPQPGEDRKISRGAFALTEPLPYIGVDTGVLCGKVRVESWNEGEEPTLKVEKRGRFITNMAFADFVTAAVGSDDDRIKGTCMVILEEDDPGLFDRGANTLKMVHQLSATTDPVLNLNVPASRIIGGYTVQDGVIVPNYSHSEIIEAVFLRTRVTPGLMTAAKLLSAVEPIMRYQRQRFHGSDVSPGTPRYELGLQQKEDTLLRLIDVWATGEASASLGFASARLLDNFEPLEAEKNKSFEEAGIKGGRAKMKALSKTKKDALSYLAELSKAETERNAALVEKYSNDTLVNYLLLEAEVNVLVPAGKLWNTGHGTNLMREAVTLMGGYGITEDCPGFLPHKWMDAQLEATYEGPECVQRRQLSATMTNDLFIALFEKWTKELKEIAIERPESGAASLAAANELWLWSLQHLLKTKDADGKALYHSKRQGVTFGMADAISWLLASRAQILDARELEKEGPNNANLAEGLNGFVSFFYDLCFTQSASAAGEVSRICTELLHAYHNQESLEANQEALAEYNRLRYNVDRCLAGARLAKDRAAQAVSHVMIPEALDYPA